ncbi:TPA: hypothetical protein ACKP8B_004122 [Serratia marcescens]
MTVDNIVKVLLCILAALLAFAFANIYAVQYIKLNDWGVWANWAAAIANIVLALIALCGLFKVNTWLKVKENEASFIKALDFLEALVELNINFSLMKSTLERLLSVTDTSDSRLNRVFNNFDEEYASYFRHLSNVVKFNYTMNSFGVYFIHEKKLNISLKRLKRSATNLRTIYGSLHSICTMKEGRDIKKIHKRANNTISELKKVITEIDKLNKLPFKEKIEFRKKQF